MNFHSLFFGMLFLLIFSNVHARVFHVTVNANNQGVGNIQNPWPLEKALKQRQTIKPGDTILIHNGIYRGHFLCNLEGSKTKPVVIMSSKDEWAIFDLSTETAPTNAASLLSVKGKFLIFKDFEIRNSSTGRISKLKGGNPRDLPVKMGLEILGPDNKFINLVIHDNTNNNIGFWKTAERSEIYGCILYYAGWDGADRGHGYNIYTQNGSPEFKPHEYSEGKIVRYKDKFYKAIKHHGDGIRPWNRNRRYPKNAKVFYKGSLYISQKKFKEQGVLPGKSVYWKKVSPEEIDSHLPTNSTYWTNMGEKDPAGSKIIANSFIFSSHRTGVSSYNENGSINNYIYRDNVIFENGQISKYGRQWNLLVGGINAAKDIYLENNTFYFNPDTGGRPVQLGYKNNNDNASVIGNSFINQGLLLRKWKRIELKKNVFHHTEALRINLKNKPDLENYHFDKNIYYTWNETPIAIEGNSAAQSLLEIQKKLEVDKKSVQLPASKAKNEIKIVPNKYDSSKLYITIHNFEKLDNVLVSFSRYLKIGTQFRIIDVQNYFGDPILLDVYDGKSISLPMTLTEVAKPLGDVSVKPVHTGKELGTFILVMED